ncbi:hypothetical protein BFO01nite_27130 [Brevibacillus formosus]|uniref:Uncharacterized protein n=1 Tax=Brevibacillus formosus TaxID=54913 RepID=A0ABQ0T5F9_9BACL|nr:hypothetical protein C7R91_10310 [Brevibacillus formosus]GED58581.1 hypothetical protein BFO01nite_27130 [Brevibacillus formosus]
MYEALFAFLCPKSLGLSFVFVENCQVVILVGSHILDYGRGHTIVLMYEGEETIGANANFSFRGGVLQVKSQIGLQ